MRSVIALLGLLALLSLAACGNDQTTDQAKSADDVAAQAVAAGTCDPATCAKAAAGACGGEAAHGAEAQTAGADVPAPAGKVYGQGVSSGQTVLVSALLAAPDQYLGHTVRVQGPVVGVCKHRGCWIEVAGDREMQKIQLKVNDGEIVFPPEIMGQKAIVEGVFEGIPLNYEQACAYLEQESSCQGGQFDKSTVPADGITFYRIKGTGAVVLASADS
ncbi:MAG: DUF4920 domain-containing protein [Candidatus Krumholzibacteriia bacterium]